MPPALCSEAVRQRRRKMWSLSLQEGQTCADLQVLPYSLPWQTLLIELCAPSHPASEPFSTHLFRQPLFLFWETNPPLAPRPPRRLCIGAHPSSPAQLAHLRPPWCCRGHRRGWQVNSFLPNLTSVPKRDRNGKKARLLSKKYVFFLIFFCFPQKLTQVVKWMTFSC